MVDSTGHTLPRATDDRGASERPRLYEMVRDQLIDDVASGRIPAGAYLPSVREITVGWTVSTTTARTALGEVVRAGYARAEQRGHVSTGPSIPSSAGDDMTGNRSVEAPASSPERTELHYPPEGGDLELDSPHTGNVGSRLDWSAIPAVRPGQVVRVDDALSGAVVGVDVRTEVPPAEVALGLRNDPADTVIVRRRVTVDAAGSPIQLRTSYLLRELVEDTVLAQPEVIGAPWFEALSTNTPVRFTELADSYITARHPTDAEASALALTPTACVLVRVDLTHDDTGSPVDYTVTVWPGETTRVSCPR